MSTLINVNFKTGKVTSREELEETTTRGFQRESFCSDCISEAIWNPDTEVLIVKFSNSGEFYMYEDCCEDTYDSIFNNGSVGRRYWKYRSWMTAKGKISQKQLEKLTA